LRARSSRGVGAWLGLTGGVGVGVEDLVALERCAAMSLGARFVVGVALLIALVTLSARAGAHTLGLSRSEWRVESATLAVRIELARADALALAPSADVDADGALAASELAAEGVARRAVGERLRIEAAGVACVLESATLALQEEDGVLFDARYRCGEGARTAELGALFAVLPAGHRQAAFVHVGEAAPREALLHAGASGLALGSAEGRAEPTSRLDVARDYVVLGVEHIWFGIDHVVFLLGLVLIGGRLRDVVAMATAFTIAHSITLALAVLELVVPSGAIIEPLIALSVAYVGVENLRGTEPEKRWRITAAFGLVHGFGFAGALAEVGLPQESVPLALLSFNVGVELGQLAILAAVVPLLARLHARRWFRERAVPILSGAIVLVGVGWFVERVFF
jgi:hypothetical protein